MRIVSGEFKGRRFYPPSNLPVRPTTDYAKEGLFNVLQNLIDITETSVADLFTGTGNIALEFVSRGAPHVQAYDIERRCVEFIQKTALLLHIEDILRVKRQNVKVLLKQMPEPVDLVFADPPYDMPDLHSLPDEILASGLVKPGGWLIVEHSEKHDFREHSCFYQLRQYGKVRFSLFRNPE